MLLYKERISKNKSLVYAFAQKTHPCEIFEPAQRSVKIFNEHISMVKKTTLFLIGLCLVFLSQSWAQNSVRDLPFVQEFHRAYPAPGGAKMGKIHAVAVDSTGTVWTGWSAGLFRLDKSRGCWNQAFPKRINGPVFDLFVDRKGILWIGAWDGVYFVRSNRLSRVLNTSGPISAVCVAGEIGLALGPIHSYKRLKSRWVDFQTPTAREVRQIVPDGRGGFWIATGMGAYHQSGQGVVLYQKNADILSADVRGVALDSDGNAWLAGLGGVTVYRNGCWVASYTPKEGLPNAWATCVARAPDGRMWVGTKLGLVQFGHKSVSVRSSRRWLLDDRVVKIAFDSAGNAWVATQKGVSEIARRRMTLAQKAAFFERICLKRHVREPGLIEKCKLQSPGDTLHWAPRDDDNDGQYTSMALAAQAFHYAVTPTPALKSRARKTFNALAFLQTVTQTPGFVARTVVPTSWKHMADPNRTWTNRQWAEAVVADPRRKRVENQWRLSADGKWRWKGDTSSDEITGHMFGYLFYYDLVADAREKKRVSRHICKIVDYIVKGGFLLRDLDGKPTRWGVWAPEKLNHDPDWAAERGINSVEMLSYLKLAYHVSGNPKYEKIYRKLAFQHHYAENARRAKTYERSWRTHIDDELLALAFPALLLYEKDPKLKTIYRESLEWWYKGVKADHSPFFDFVYGALSGKNPQPEISVAALRDASLDLVRWRLDNSRREDLHLVRRPELESLQTSRLLPVSERGVMRWDNNPWNAVQGDGGWTESSGVWWLLSYWMGRYYGFIRK